VILAEEPHPQVHPEVPELDPARRGERLTGAGVRGAAAVLVGDEGEVDADVQPVPQREAAVEVQVELVLHHRADLGVAGDGANDERIVGVVGEEHDVRGELARGEGRRHAEHPVARGRRIEAIQRQGSLVRLRRRRSGRHEHRRPCGCAH
jgi:hypothetical protein